jgi:uncharacterized protein (TIGR02246 family)
MRFCPGIPVLIAFMLILASCSPAPEEPAAEVRSQAEDVAAIKTLADDAIAAHNAGDAAAIAALLTDDAVLMPPNEPTVIGKEAAQSGAQTVFDHFTVKLTAELVEVEVAGDWAFGRGTFTYTATPKAGGEPIEGSDRFLTIYRRQLDGSWKIHRDIYNSHKPIPGTDLQKTLSEGFSKFESGQQEILIAIAEDRQGVRKAFEVIAESLHKHDVGQPAGTAQEAEKLLGSEGLQPNLVRHGPRVGQLLSKVLKEGVSDQAYKLVLGDIEYGFTLAERYENETGRPCRRYWMRRVSRDGSTYEESKAACRNEKGMWTDTR